MGRDWTPLEHYMVEQRQIKQGYGDLFDFLESMKFVSADGKETIVNPPEDMVVRRQFPMLGKLLMDDFMSLHEKMSQIPGGIEFLHKKDIELAEIVRSNDFNREGYLAKWFTGKLDEHFYYSDRNNELFCANVLLEAQLLTDKVWVTVYKDTLGYQDDLDNLTEILVPGEWLIKQLQSEGVEDFGAWFDEYTADETEKIAHTALAEGVVLDCNDKRIDIVCDDKSECIAMVRALSEADIKQVKALDDLSGNAVADMVDSPEYAWGIFVGSELVGYCTIGGADDTGHDDYEAWTYESLCLSDVFVKEEHRGKGLASRLINEALEKCNSENEASVFITILDDKLSCLYEKLGFKALENGDMVREKGQAPSLETQIKGAAQINDRKVSPGLPKKDLER